MKHYFVAFMALLLAAPAAAQERVRVVATISILADLVRNVGGDRVEVVALVPPDGDAHVWQPTPADGRALAGARLLVRNGLGLEGPALNRLVRAVGYRGAQVEAAAQIQARAADAHRHSHGPSGRHANESVRPGRAPDPHGWQSVRNAILYARAIERALAAADPAGAPAYRANADAYAARLEALDAWVRGRIATVPQSRRRVLTSHDAFGYFSAEYGVEFVSVQGTSTGREPSAAELARVVAQARRENIRAVFLENMSDPRLAARLATELGVPVADSLYSDALSAAGGPAPTYEALVRHNVEALVAAMARN